MAFLLLLKSYDKPLLKEYLDNKASDKVINRLKGIDKMLYFSESQLGVHVVAQIISGVLDEKGFDAYCERALNGNNHSPAALTGAGRNKLVSGLSSFYNFGAYDHAEDCIKK